MWNRRIERLGLVGDGLPNMIEADLVEIVVEVSRVVEDTRQLRIRAHRTIGERDQQDEQSEQQAAPDQPLRVRSDFRDLRRHARRQQAIPVPHMSLSANENAGNYFRRRVVIGPAARWRMLDTIAALVGKLIPLLTGIEPLSGQTLPLERLHPDPRATTVAQRLVARTTAQQATAEIHRIDLSA